MESYFREEVQKVGALCFKFTSPGTRGVPDRIVVSKKGVFFVELKRPKGGRLSPHQKRWQMKFEQQEQKIHVIKNREEVDVFVKSYLT